MSNSGIASPGTKIIASASNSFLQLTVVQSSLGLDAVDNNGTDTGSLTGGTGLTSVSSSPPSTSQVPGSVVVNNVRAILNSGSKWVFKPTSNTDEFSIMLEQAELYLAYNLSGKKVIAATAPVTLDVKTSPTISDAFQIQVPDDDKNIFTMDADGGFSLQPFNPSNDKSQSLTITNI